MKFERNKIVLTFNLAVVCFAIQSMTILLAYDSNTTTGVTPLAAVTILLMIIVSVSAAFDVMRMRYRLSRKAAALHVRQEKRCMMDYLYGLRFMFSDAPIREAEARNTMDARPRGYSAHAHINMVQIGLNKPLVQNLVSQQASRRGCSRLFFRGYFVSIS
jgi:hypothetical protein